MGFRRLLFVHALGLDSLIYPFANPSVFPILLFAGVFGAAVPTVMILAGIRMAGSSRASILALTEPVAGMLIAAVVLSQTMLPIQITGGVLVLVALVLLQLYTDKDSRPQN